MKAGSIATGGNIRTKASPEWAKPYVCLKDSANIVPLVVSGYLLTIRSHLADDCAKDLLPASATGGGRRLCQFESPNKRKRVRPKGQTLFLARCKGLEPLTYWFVASHSIQLS